MKLKFKNQQFQTDAVDSVADLFKGQEKLRSTFEITNIEAIDLINQNELGIGNVISISNDALLANMHEIQRRNNLPTLKTPKYRGSACEKRPKENPHLIL